MDVDRNLLFYSQVCENTKQWLASLKEMWEYWGKSDCVTAMLTSYFEAAHNPYLSTLRILVNMPDFQHIKITSSLTYTAAEEFSKWISVRKQFYAGFLVPDIKLAAFRLISKQKNMEFIKMMCTTYEFKAHKRQFLQIIMVMIFDSKYKEAGQYATLLELQSFLVEPETLLLPLVLQNKITILDEFLKNCPNAQRALVSYLDSLLSPGTSMQEAMRSYIRSKHLSDIKFIMQPKSVAKLIGRLMKTYNLSVDICPNLHQRQSKGALYFLLNKRYVDGTLNKNSWREMVKDATDDNPKIQMELVNMLASRNDLSESLYFANWFKIPRQKWPWNVVCYKDELNDIEDDASTSEEDDWDHIYDTPSNYHTLTLPMDCIKIVNDAKSFGKFVNEGLKGVRIVGIDSEWRPRFGQKQTIIALMQIATEKNVYILDCTTIRSKCAELWIKLASNLFGNKKILKLGFGSSHDTKIIHDSLPALKKVQAYGPGYIDMILLWGMLSNNQKFRFPFEGGGDFRNGGLSKLVELCLGRKLDKSNQCSNWEQRPLRKSQIIYAALDAYCLIEVYNVLFSQCEKLGVPFQEICADIQYNTHKLLKTTRNKTSDKPANAQYEPESKYLLEKNGQEYIQNKSLQPASTQRQQEKSATKNHSVKHKNIEKAGQGHVHKESLPSASAQHQSGKSEVKSNSDTHKNVGKNEQEHTDKESLQPINTQRQPEKSAVKNSNNKHKNVEKIEQEHNYKDSLQPASGQNQPEKCAAKNNTDKHKNAEKSGERNGQEYVQTKYPKPASAQRQQEKSATRNHSIQHKNIEKAGQKHVHIESLPSASAQHQSGKSEVKSNSGKHKNVGKNGQGYTNKESLQPINIQRQPEKSTVKNSTNKHKNVEKIGQEHNYKDSLQPSGGQNQAEKCTAKNNIDKHKNAEKSGERNGQEYVQKKPPKPASAQREQEKSATRNHSVQHKNIEKAGQKHVHNESLPSASAQHKSEKSEVKSNIGKHKNVRKNGQEHADKESLQQPEKSAVKNSTNKHKNVEKVGQAHNYEVSLQPASGQNQPEKSTAKNNTDKHNNAEKSGEEPKRRDVTTHENIYENKLDGILCEPTVDNYLLSYYAGTVSPKSVPAHTWRVVCDSMLGGLSHKLRTFGCDCIHIEYDKDGYMSSMLASRENRILLTRNTDYQKFLQLVPPGSCYRVISETPKNQLREVLTYFNVIVTPKDIFSRCLNCNSDEFAHVPKSLMDSLVSRFAKLTNSQEYECFLNSLPGAFDIDQHNKISNKEHNPNKATGSHKVEIPDRTWRLNMNTLNVSTCTTKYNAQIQFGNVPLRVLENIELFYICERCGKVFWDSGTYLERLLKGALKDLIVQ